MKKQKDEFQIRSYGWRELASHYSPDIQPKSAAKRLKDWVLFNVELYEELVETGWQIGQRLLTPRQVQVLVRRLGTP